MRLAPPSRGGKGYAVCDRSGFLVPAEERIKDVRGGSVRPESADLTPGFGTRHPRDVARVPLGPDPLPIDDARPEPVPQSFDELGITDQERERRLREAP